MADVKKLHYAFWAVAALVAAGIAYAMVFSGPDADRRVADSCYERRAQSFPTELSDAFKAQIIQDCEMETRKIKGVR